MLCCTLTVAIGCPDVWHRAARPASPLALGEAAAIPTHGFPSGRACVLAGKHSRRSCLERRGDASERGGSARYPMWARLARPLEPNVYHLWIHRAAPKQTRRVVVLAISVGTSCLPDSRSLPSQQVPAGFLLPFILWSRFSQASGVGGCRAQRLTKISPDLWPCL